VNILSGEFVPPSCEKLKETGTAGYFVFNLSAEVYDSVFQRKVVPFYLFLHFAEMAGVVLPFLRLHFINLLVL
jgi:hypothetical protein